MSKFGEPIPCRNSCGAYIYFDRDSEVGHPSSDKWIPLVFEKDTGARTNTPHQCPKSPFTKSQQQQQQTQQIQQQHQQPQAQSLSKEDLIIGLLKDLKIQMNHVIKLLEGRHQ